MEKQKTNLSEMIIEDILADKEKIFEAIRTSPALKRKHEKAAEDFAKLQRPFPWEKEKAGTHS